MTPRTSMTLTNMHATAKKALCDSSLYWRKSSRPPWERIETTRRVCAVVSVTCGSGLSRDY
jgi:hypothetical protein